ncbi:MAG: sigma-70 family RNA polymerase sigma factor [Lentisphaerales bacterium]|nr:sigma-70 family RNA polymerase sigma factor [Lentisphaerales bacterium]
MNERWNTRKSLLLRAADQNDHKAFEEFAVYYEDFIRIIIMKLGVSTEDYKDLQQNILLKLWKSLSKFDMEHENASFRGWLGTVIRNDVYKFFNSKKRTQEAIVTAEGLSISIDSLGEDSNDNEFQKLIESEWKAYVITIAIEHIKPYFSGNAMEIFSLTLDGLSVKEIADKLGVKENTVYMLRSRVKARFQKEVKNIRQLLEFPNEE